MIDDVSEASCPRGAALASLMPGDLGHPDGLARSLLFVSGRRKPITLPMQDSDSIPHASETRRAPATTRGGGAGPSGGRADTRAAAGSGHQTAPTERRSGFDRRRERDALEQNRLRSIVERMADGVVIV